MRGICLVALIGLPGAGKSSLCTWLLGQQAALRVRHIVHLCYDDFLDAGPSAELAYKEQRRRIFGTIEQLITAIQEDIDWPAQTRRRTASNSDPSSSGHLILCDDNFYYRSMRHKLHQLCRTSGCVFGQIHIARSLDLCLRDNSKRSGANCVPVDIVRQMSDRLEPPGSEAWERNSLTLHILDMDERERLLLGFISSLLEMPAVPPATESQQAQDQSLTHRLDLLLRARIGALLQEIAQEVDRRLAGQALNNKRKQILTRFRTEGGGEEAKGDAEDEALNYYVHLLN
ncbi:L-seryl-tRNA(Sec) kinase [Drosophila biarmipes]|uniref:L-seryl-tRNA(Sec) kinase n=1 Tax=Drosophila biarmipes TaxID=125945 RepID=UPI0007E6A5D3|nr:L-seryl-tRNA(Sec) kinase [Drosophila biarmipes]